MSKGTLSGLHFGLTSGVITTLGLIVGLHSGTHSQLAVVGGIVTIAVADAMSDALGIHVSKEAEGGLSTLEVWKATATTFGAKLVMASSFLAPVLILELETAILVSIGWGLGILGMLSYRLARLQGVKALPVIAEHTGIAVLVIVVTHLLGGWVAHRFPPL